MRPFLEILTRCYRRPAMLAANMASVERLGVDVEHTLMPDLVGRGIGWASEQLATRAGGLRGEYIWILDDDDKCIRATLVEELQAIVAERDPDVIMLRMDHGPLGVLPDDDVWGKQPVCGRIGVSAYVVRREVFQKHAGAWRPGHYASDFDFINAIFGDPAASICWHDVVASQVQRISQGRPESTNGVREVIMAKKRVDRRPTPTPEDGFTLGFWHNLPMWKCNRCRWTTLNGEGAMRAHIATVHVPKAPPAARPVAHELDRFGNPINEGGD